MAQRQLYGTYIIKGETYGPGQAELPDDLGSEATKRLDELEGVAKERFSDQLRQSVVNLPPGHPFERMYAAMSNEQEVGSAMAGDNYISKPDRAGTAAETILDETEISARTASWSRAGATEGLKDPAPKPTTPPVLPKPATASTSGS